MTVTVRIDLKKMDILIPKITNAVNEGLKRIGNNIERDGKIFAPIDTGLLKATIKSIPSNLKVLIGSPLKYAGIMEQPGNVLTAGQRPYMHPSLLKNIPTMANIIAQEIKKVTK